MYVDKASYTKPQAQPACTCFTG